jgi:hypothetical protein
MQPFSQRAAESVNTQGKVGFMMERKAVTYREPYETRAVRPQKDSSPGWVGFHSRCGCAESFACLEHCPRRQ